MKTKRKIVAVAVIVIAFIALVLGLFAAHWKIQQLGLSNGYANMGRSGRMMTQGKGIYPASIAYNDENKFTLPEDAAKSGELAIIVDNLDSAKKSVADAAAKNGGSIYATFISYASNNIKNGSVVVRIPAENFDATFGELEKIGSQIVQESTRQIPQRNIYPYPVPMNAGSAVSAQPEATDVAAKNISGDESANIGGGASAATSSIAMPAYYPQPVQDKGYIKVIFADYGTIGNTDNDESRFNISRMIGIGYIGQNLRSNIWVVLGVKSILLIALVVILIVIAKRIVQNLRKNKKNKHTITVVKQMPKSRPKAVKIKNKKV